MIYDRFNPPPVNPTYAGDVVQKNYKLAFQKEVIQTDSATGEVVRYTDVPYLEEDGIEYTDEKIQSYYAGCNTIAQLYKKYAFTGDDSVFIQRDTTQAVYGDVSGLSNDMTVNMQRGFEASRNINAYAAAVAEVPAEPAAADPAPEET